MWRQLPFSRLLTLWHIVSSLPHTFPVVWSRLEAAADMAGYSAEDMSRNDLLRMASNYMREVPIMSGIGAEESSGSDGSERGGGGSGWGSGDDRADDMSCGGSSSDGESMTALTARSLMRVSAAGAALGGRGRMLAGPACGGYSRGTGGLGLPKSGPQASAGLPDLT